MTVDPAVGKGSLPLDGESPDGRARATAMETLDSLSVRPAPAVSFRSEGRVLIVGPRAAALAAAARLAPPLRCTLVVTDAPAPQPHPPVIEGRIDAIEGALGGFRVSLAGPDGTVPMARLLDEGVDLVLDLQQPPSLDHSPPGYFAPGGDPAVLERALETLPGLVGEFEQPRFLVYDPAICAHGRSGIAGCSRCLDVCPSGALAPAGERIEWDPRLCDGAGSCATACPSGALGYAWPRLGDLLERVRILVRTYREAGGSEPTLLLYDAGPGRLLLQRLATRLPGNLLPLQLEEIASAGLDVWLAALAYGAARVLLLTTAATEPLALAELERQSTYARSLLEAMGHPATALTPVTDESALWQALEGGAAAVRLEPANFAPQDEKRTVLRLAIDHLHRQAPKPRPLALLPEGAPFGEVWLNGARCTLCMACVSQCPGNALQAGDELPQLKFIEENCIQCGLCARSCPENAIGPSPRYLFDPQQRRRARLLKEEEPFRCIRCGKPFATRSVIGKVLTQLRGNPMFAQPGQLRRLEMCEDCRVRDLYEAERAQSAGPGEVGP